MVRIVFLFILCFCQFFMFISFAEDKVGRLQVEMSIRQCERLIPQVFAASANYYEGVDSRGRAVVPADGGEKLNFGIIPEIVTFDMEIDFSRYSGGLGEKLGKIGLTSTSSGVYSLSGSDEFFSDASREELDLSQEDRDKLARINNDINSLEVYERELVWTRKAILGDSLDFAEDLVKLQNERKQINKQVELDHKRLEGEKARIIQSTGGEEEKNQGMLSLRKRQLKNAEEEFYYGEDYLRLQRRLSLNSEAQERMKNAMSLRDRAESEGEQEALLVNERALTKTRASLENLYRQRSGILGDSVVRENKLKGDDNQNLPRVPYGLSRENVGEIVRVEYDLSKGLLTLNGYPLEPVEITRLIEACRSIKKN